MHYLRLAVLSVFATAPLACLGTPLAPRWGDMLVKHTWGAVPAKWESLGRPAASATIDLHFALKPHRESALVDALFDVSDPKRSTYGAHLSREQVAQFVAPHPDTLSLVKSWLQHHGLSSSISMTHGGGWMTVSGVPVSQANDLLGASYQIYRHTGTNGTNKSILRTVSYALPAALHAHVQTVSPTTYFALPHTLQQTPRKLSRGEAATEANAMSGEPLTARSWSVNRVVPNFLRWLYKTTTYLPTSPDNVLAVVGFADALPSHDDLTTFMANLRTGAEDATFAILPVNGGLDEYNPRQPNAEANMDIQYAEAITYPVQHVYYSTGGHMMMHSDSYEPGPGDSYLEWFNYVLSRQYIPQTISISYGIEERLVPLEYAIALCELFVHLGARGVSVLFASGDVGVGPEDCRDGSGEVRFVPTFPASCPFVTSVGGTTSFGPEIAASLSGGGFSDYFLRPSYQDVAVDAYLQRLDNLRDGMYGGLYNRIGRGIPDISAQALNFMIVIDHQYFLFDGTSCATPTVAAVVSLLNDFLISNGKPPLGFLNPWLYDLGQAGLTDIKFGSNPGCQTDGFSASDGWDPVTGLGTPNFLLMKYVLYLMMG